MDRRYPHTRVVGRIVLVECRLEVEFKTLSGLDPPRGLVSVSSPLVRRQPNAEGGRRMNISPNFF